MFPEVARYCGQYRLGLKPPPRITQKKKVEKEDEPCDFSNTDGISTLQILVYMSMTNISDINGDASTELRPFLHRITHKDLPSWNVPVHDYGCILLGYQNTEVSGAFQGEYSIYRI
jgi:hypothetical protein